MRATMRQCAAMPLLRCLSTLGCPELSLDDTFALAARHHVSAIEVRALGGTVDLPAYLTDAYGTPERLRERLRTSAVRLVAFNASLHLVGATAEEREQLVALGAWAHGAGMRWLRVFDGGKKADATELAEASATLQWWRDVCVRERWAVELMVETHDSLFTAETLGRFRSAAPGVAVLWDAHHTWKKGGEDPVVTWRAIRDAVVHVHVKDSISVASARHPFTYVLPGDGEFPMRAVREALESDGFTGPVSLEWERLWHPYLPPLDTALSVAAQRGWW